MQRELKCNMAFCSLRGLSLLLRTPWMALHSLRDLWTYCKRRAESFITTSPPLWDWPLDMADQGSGVCFVLLFYPPVSMACMLVFRGMEYFQSFTSVFLQAFPTHKVSTGNRRSWGVPLKKQKRRPWLSLRLHFSLCPHDVTDLRGALTVAIGRRMETKVGLGAWMES